MELVKKILVIAILALFLASCIFRACAEVTADEARSVMDNVSVSLEKAFVAVA